MTKQTEQNRHNNFNLLRLVFAILVLLSHSFELIDGNRSREILTSIFHTVSFGELAVDGFFLLSGYLIVQSWQSRPQAWQFLKNRILRIYPGFIVATIICTFIVAPLASNEPQYFANFPFLMVLENSLLLNPPLTRTVFLGQPYPYVNGSMWSIVLEFQCYIVVLLIGWLGGISKRKIWFSLTLVVLFILCSQKLGFPFPDDIHLKIGNEIFVELINLRLGSFFLVGGCFYLYKEKIPLNPTIASISAVLLILLMSNNSLNEFALAIFGGYLLLKFAFMPSKLLTQFLKFPDVSYGVYLYGWPTQKILHWNYPMMTPWILFTLTCCICLVCGLISWYGIEKPFLKLKSNYQSEKR